ncbi:hypothetical protein CANINC_000915 [Pichia inconspicua]|uniref:FAD dependent oxidoreductase domain-containing protein n=1 Tax=Pichia inconspicua TaxID=52247 RepID=A0A4V4NG46_9ASCO|nr:hypothetical protein CANINC_000915 [[Candida] inconspicua]
MIVILGAGVIGLSTAYYIKQTSPGTSIVIIAEEFPREGELSSSYTTSKSGAHFRPFPSKNDDERRDAELTRDTYEFFKKLSVEHPESSIKFIRGIDYIEYDNEFYESLGSGFTEVVEDFKVLEKRELPRNVKFGAEYKTWSIDPHKYVTFLFNYLLMHGVKMINKHVESLLDIEKEYPEGTIVNATGFGFDDDSVYSIRGQTLLVRPPIEDLREFEDKTVTYQLENGEWCFVIPRPLNGGIILGGTKDIKNKSKEVDYNEISTLIENARLRFPELFYDNGKLEILRVNVGFRPSRNGGVRLEKIGCVVHVYGFGGSGIEMSWGAAIRAGNLALRSGGLL